MEAVNFTGTEPLANPAALNLTALKKWLIARIEGCEGQISVERFRGGQSNPTLLLSFDGKRKLVIRKKPEGKLLPSAHAVDREFRVISALQNSDVPVAPPRAFCDDDSVLGTMFYVMDYVPGRSFWEPWLPDLSPPERAAIYAEMNRVIAALHLLPWQEQLSGFGRPETYVARQVARWSRQYAASETVSIPAMDRLMAWLPENIPAQRRASLIHGDFRIDNLIFHPTEPRIAAVVDWELSTIGDPMADFAYSTLTWNFSRRPYRGLADLDLAGSGIPDARAYRDAYLRATGQETVSDRDWYALLAFSLFRVAAIRQGIRKRVVEGNAVSPHARAAGELAADVAELGWSYAEKAMQS